MKYIQQALAIATILTLTFPAWSEGTKKTKLNTNLYEKENAESSISGKVKTVREVQGETEVFIDNPKGHSGPYVLPENFPHRAKAIKTLNNSQKPGGGAVTISIDDQQRIKSVEESQTSNKKEWDF